MSDNAARAEYDEEGQLRLVQNPDVKLKYIVGRSVPQTTRRTWAIDPTCAHCGAVINRPKHAALVITADKSHRVAHRGSCFVLALVAAHPTITTAAALVGGQ